jgi:hypothetical protein
MARALAASARTPSGLTARVGRRVLAAIEGGSAIAEMLLIS